MRLAYGLVGVSVLGIAGLIAACGSSTNAGSPLDAGTDATSPDASPDAGPGDDGGCVIDADLYTLSPNDAALNEAGASVGTCIACAKTTCNSGVNLCNGDCACNGAIACLFECLSGVGGALTFCAAQCIQAGDGGGSLLSGLDLAETTLLTCAVKQCGGQCGVGGLLGGGGGGHDGGQAHDAGADAGEDAAADGGEDGGTDAADAGGD